MGVCSGEKMENRRGFEYMMLDDEMLEKWTLFMRE